MFKNFKVGTILATRNGLTEYEVERVHVDGYTVVEAHLSPQGKRIARRYRVKHGDLVATDRVQLTAFLPSAA